MTKQDKKWYLRWYMIVLYCFIGFWFLINFAVNEGAKQINGAANKLDNNLPQVNIENKLDKITMGEKNALDSALSYLQFMAFSHSRLIEQLEYEGYSYEEAKYGVDNCGANWNEQAALSAQSYLDVMPFSREGLIDQLIYEGFTKNQAEYGIQAVGY